MFSIDHIALPVLMAAYAIELMLALIHHRREVARDMVVNLSLGIGNITAGFFMKGVSLAVYSGVYAYAFFRPQLSPLLWIAGFLSCDFVIYLYHRLGHTARMFWAAHVAHQSSLHYNHVYRIARQFYPYGLSLPVLGASLPVGYSTMDDSVF